MLAPLRDRRYLAEHPMTTMVLRLLLGVGAALALTWVALVFALLVARPEASLLAEALRLLPDVLRLLRRLAGDRSLARDVRIRLWLVLGYLAIPIDLVPDFVPVLGYADDAIIVTAVLRSVVRSAGLEPIWGIGREPRMGSPPSCGCVAWTTSPIAPIGPSSRIRVLCGDVRPCCWQIAGKPARTPSIISCVSA
jgi:uncharacterized membrane protein YkvA (DUF1232 family)